MLRFLLEKKVTAFERAFHYDATYMREILAESRKAFLLVARMPAMSSYRRGIPLPAWYAAKIAAGLHEDCGPCTQLVVDMAARDGLSPEVIRGIVGGDEAAMGPGPALAARFARAVLAHDPAADGLREEVVRRWGKGGLVSIALVIAAARVYPTLKAALGHAKACSVLRLGEGTLPVRRATAA